MAPNGASRPGCTRGRPFNRKALSCLRPVPERHTSCYSSQVKFFSWDAKKNAQLKATRGISFEEITFHVERGDVLDIVEHPNPRRYPGQRVFVINVGSYVYLVPFVEGEQDIFLKTIIPSRKATKKYLRTEKKHG
jgi:uncharacterized DUF497 family protein